MKDASSLPYAPLAWDGPSRVGRQDSCPAAGDILWMKSNGPEAWRWILFSPNLNCTYYYTWLAAATAAKSLQSSLTLQPHRQQPIRLPVPGILQAKNTGVGCHFLLQCMKMKSESEVAQSCPTLNDPLDCSPPGSSVHGIFQARELEWGAINTK